MLWSVGLKLVVGLTSLIGVPLYIIVGVLVEEALKIGF
jgi:hypothetical protein